jgi:uncharacterized protein (TIGR03118 family)
MSFNAFTSRGYGSRSGFLFAIVAGGTLAAMACSSDTTPNPGPDSGSGDGAASGSGGKSGSGGSGQSGGAAGSSTGGSSASGGTSGGGTGGSGTGGKGTGGKGTGGAAGSAMDGGTSPDGATGEDGGVTAFMVTKTNLVADPTGTAPTIDPNLLNPWGLVANPTAGFFWVSDNHSGMATVYAPTGGASVLNVKIPGPPDTDGGFTSAPTGQVFNGTAADFMGDKFIVDSEDGTITGWQTNGQPFVVRVDNSADSGYKGLALIKNGANAELVAANFHKGTVDVFDSTYAPVATPGFVDTGSPALPAGFAAFNVAAIDTSVYITYAKQDADKADDTAGPGNGYVSVFKTDGTFVKRLVSGGALNSPWGMAVAPASWGAMAGALLVGNFGDGTVNAYDLTTGAPRGSLVISSGPLVISGLWALVVGPKTATADDSGSIFFTAGTNGEEGGLYGKLDPT